MECQLCGKSTFSPLQGQSSPGLTTQTKITPGPEIQLVFLIATLSSRIIMKPQALVTGGNWRPAFHMHWNVCIGDSSPFCQRKHYFQTKIPSFTLPQHQDRGFILHILYVSTVWGRQGQKTAVARIPEKLFLMFWCIIAPSYTKQNQGNLILSFFLTRSSLTSQSNLFWKPSPFNSSFSILKARSSFLHNISSAD